MQRSTILALSLLSFGALLPAACTQNFDFFAPSGGAGGSTSSTTTSTSHGPGTGGTGGSGGCSTDSDCDDANPCTTDTCTTSTRKCKSVAVPDGAVPGYTDTMMDCQTQSCVSGMQQTVNADTEVPDDGDPCTTDSCSGGVPQHVDASKGTTCGMSNGTTLLCDGMDHCVGCNSDTDCNDPGECKTRTCDGNQTCQFGSSDPHDACSDGVCDGNGNCVGCVDAGDCNGTNNAACENNACIDQCTDGMKNGNETDTDCGGNACGKCDVDKTCLSGFDCQTGYCNGSGVCKQPTCNDGAKNGSETDTDCGGGNCPKCPTSDKCNAGTDCMSGDCYHTGGGMGQKTCHADLCSDAAKDGSETDVDCGGATCTTKCANNKHCAAGSDCASGTCVATLCVVNQCTDGFKDGSETDTDCGGTCPTKCANGKGCGTGADCTSGLCNPLTSQCAATQCPDGVKDGAETDIDCGGGSCSKCANGKGCGTGADCTSGLCNPLTSQCAATQCPDGVKDGAETDIDCGGGSCATCGTGKACAVNGDCTNGTCTAMVCN